MADTFRVVDEDGLHSEERSAREGNGECVIRKNADAVSLRHQQVTPRWKVLRMDLRCGRNDRRGLGYHTSLASRECVRACAKAARSDSLTSMKSFRCYYRSACYIDRGMWRLVGFARRTADGGPEMLILLGFRAADSSNGSRVGVLHVIAAGRRLIPVRGGQPGQRLQLRARPGAGWCR